MVDDISRRNALGLLGGGTAATLALATPLAARSRRRAVFPKNFRWGCATSAYQIEGAVAEDGRGESIWDVFCKTPGRIHDKSSGEVASDSYHRYKEDSGLLKDMGANSYRLSFAWPRFFPEGRGQLNQKAVDHYQRVVDDLLEKGIEPYVTLYHWDLPTALPGGWQNRDTASAFADYAGAVAERFADRVTNFMTLNEVGSFIEIGYGSASHAPGLKLPRQELNQARHHALLAHGLGVQAIRSRGRSSTRVGFAENPVIAMPALETPPYIEAARKAFREINRAILVPMMEGQYPASFLEAEAANAPRIMDGDMAAIGSRVDFVGINIYTGIYVEPLDAPAGFRPVFGGKMPTMGLDWLRVTPESMYWGPRLLNELWKPKGIFISENGAPAADRVVSGRVLDPSRVMYLRNYLGQLERAIADGHPVKGYFAWTLLDNFEWAEGYAARFGVHFTDFETQRRTPKLSAAWLKEVFTRGVLV